MSIARDKILEKVFQWIEYADEDWRLASFALEGMSSCVPYRLIAYHAQQCAEKYLKAFLVFREVDFPYTHNISLLLELCEKQASWVERLRAAKTLSRFAATVRYPGDYKSLTVKDAKEALEIAGDVRNVIRKVLIKDFEDC